MLNQNPQHLVVEAQQLLPLIVANALHLLSAIIILLIGFWLAGRAHRLVAKALYQDSLIRTHGPSRVIRWR